MFKYQNSIAKNVCTVFSVRYSYSVLNFFVNGGRLGPKVPYFYLFFLLTGGLHVFFCISSASDPCTVGSLPCLHFARSILIDARIVCGLSRFATEVCTVCGPDWKIIQHENTLGQPFSKNCFWASNSKNYIHFCVNVKLKVSLNLGVKTQTELELCTKIEPISFKLLSQS